MSSTLFDLIVPDKEPVNGSITVVLIGGCDYVMRRLYKGAITLGLSPDGFNKAHDDTVIMSSDETAVELVGQWFGFSLKKNLIREE